MLSGRLPCGQANFGVVPNKRQMSGRSSYTSQPFWPRCGQLKSASAAACCSSDLRGSLAISSLDVVTGPQQSWQPGMHANAGIWRRKNLIFWLLIVIVFLMLEMCRQVKNKAQAYHSELG